MEFNTTNMFNSDEEDNQVNKSSKCIIYTDLILDNLYAIQWLTKMYNKIYILHCNLNNWRGSEYKMNYSLNSVWEKIRSWGDVVIIGQDYEPIKELEESDLYLLAPLTEFVKLVENEEFKFFMNLPTVMLAGEEIGEDGAGSEYNAMQDEDAYKFVIKNVKTLCQVTKKMCKRMFKEKNYPFKAEYLEEYIEKIGKIDGEEVYCNALQAAKYGYDALKSIKENISDEGDDEIEIYGIVSEGKLVIKKAGSGIVKKLTNHVHVNEYVDKITEIVIDEYTGNLEGIYSLVELLPKLKSVTIEEMLSVTELHLMPWFSWELIVNIGKCSASSLNDRFVSSLKLNLTFDKCLISEELGDELFEKFGMDIIEGIESKCQKIFSEGNSTYFELDKKDYNRINSVILINILFGTRVRSKGNLLVIYKTNGMLAGPGGYYFEKGRASVNGELEIGDNKYSFDIDFF